MSDKVHKSVVKKGGEEKDKNEQNVNESGNSKKKFSKKKALLIGGAVIVGTAATVLIMKGIAHKKLKDYLISAYDVRMPEKFIDFAERAKDNKLNDDDVILKAGQIFHRMSSVKVEDLTDAARIYASYTEEDNNRYKAVLPSFFRNWVKDIPGFKYEGNFNRTLQAITDIKSPSEKKRYEIFKDLLFNDADFQKFMAPIFPPDESFARDLYNSFAVMLNNNKLEPVKKYYDEVLKAGYNAIIDDNDRNVLSEMPILIINPGNVLVEKGVEKINSLKRFAAIMKLKDI